MFELMQEVIYKVTGKRDITYETDFIKDLQLTSFDVMNIVCAFEDRLNVDIPTRDVWQLHQVKDVIAYMQEKGIELD